MFAPQSSPAGRVEGQSPKPKDVVFCEHSVFPLAVPSALLTTIWDQVNEGLRAVPRGGAEVGGLVLGRPSQSGIILAEEVVPIQTEYRFGPSFRLSDVDVTGIQTLMASIQKDPSKAVVAFYRSRTRNDSRSQESDAELLAILERAHTSFSSNFHYYIAFTPLSKMSMTASVSLRKDEGWDDWQHMTLRSNPMSASEPIEIETPKAAPASPAPEPATTRQPPTPPPAAHSEPRSLSYPEPYVPPQPPPRALANPEPHSLSYPGSQPGWMQAAPPPPELMSRLRRVPGAWYVAGAILLAAIGLGGYLRFSGQLQPRVTFTDNPVRVPTPSGAVRTGFSAAREGPLWRLTWDRAAVAALNPTGAVLDIHDGGKEQQVGLTPSDLSSGTILYTPQTGDLLFSLNIVLPGSQLAEEHVRVLEAPHGTEAPSAQDREDPVKIVVQDKVRTLRPFTPSANGSTNATPRKSAAVELPAPPSFTAPTNSPLSSSIPFSSAPTGPAPIAAVPAARENRGVPVSAAPLVPSVAVRPEGLAARQPHFHGADTARLRYGSAGPRGNRRPGRGDQGDADVPQCGQFPLGGCSHARSQVLGLRTRQERWACRAQRNDPGLPIRPQISPVSPQNLLKFFRSVSAMQVLVHLF